MISVIQFHSALQTARGAKPKDGQIRWRCKVLSIKTSSLSLSPSLARARARALALSLPLSLSLSLSDAVITSTIDFIDCLLRVRHYFIDFLFLFPFYRSSQCQIHTKNIKGHHTVSHSLSLFVWSALSQFPSASLYPHLLYLHSPHLLFFLTHPLFLSLSYHVVISPPFDSLISPFSPSVSGNEAPYLIRNTVTLFSDRLYYQTLSLHPCFSLSLSLSLSNLVSGDDLRNSGWKWDRRCIHLPTPSQEVHRSTVEKQ